MPPALPPAPNCNTPLPAAPQNPPNLTDIADAIEYNRNIRISRATGIAATKDDVAQGAIYETALIEENAGIAVAPPWFVPALTAGIAAAIAPLTRSIDMLFNMQCGDGLSRAFKVIRFTNGDDPADHNLPALHNTADINALTGHEATSYINGYGIHHPHAIQARKEAIRNEIGCTAPL